MNIPDLRPDSGEVTLEHCSVLLEKLGKTLTDLYPGSDFKLITNQVNPVQMLEDLNSMFSARQFSRLFQSDIGRGLVIGMYFERFIVGDRESNNVG